MAPIRRWYGWRKLRNGEWVTLQGVVIGFTRKGELVRVPVAGWRAVMSLLLGATGSGKTILEPTDGSVGGVTGRVGMGRDRRG